MTLAPATPPPGEPAVGAAAAASSIDTTLSHVDAFLAEVDRGLADATDGG